MNERERPVKRQAPCVVLCAGLQGEEFRLVRETCAALQADVSVASSPAAEICPSETFLQGISEVALLAMRPATEDLPFLLGILSSLPSSSIPILAVMKDAEKIPESLHPLLQRRAVDLIYLPLRQEELRRRLKVLLSLSRLSGDRSSWVRSFCHDLRNPLVTIRGLAELMLMGGSSEEEIQGYLKEIIGAADTLNEKITHFSRRFREDVGSESRL